MSKSPAALYRPKKEKQTKSHEQPADERPYGINSARERPSSTASSPRKRTLSWLLSKFF